MAQLFLSPPSHTPAIFKISGDVTPAVAVKPPSRFVRRADGKGFVRRDALRGINRRAMFNLKKKKKPFRGGNYRFDGSSIKKRNAKRSGGMPNLPDELNPQVIFFLSDLLGCSHQDP